MKQQLVYSALFITLLLWASAFVGIKVALVEYAPAQLSVFRFLIASLTLGLVALIKGIQPIAQKDLPRIILVGIIGISLYNLALNYGEVTVSSGAASFIINTVPMFTLLISVLFLKEKIAKTAYFGTAISFVGVGLIAFAESNQLRLNYGIFLILVAAFSQGVFFVLQKPLLKIYSPLSLISYSVWAGTFFMLPFLFGDLETIKVAKLSTHLSVVYLGIFPGAMGYLTWTYALSKLKPHTAATFLYLIPVVSLIIGVIWIREIPTIHTVLGGFLAVGGVIIFNLKKKTNGKTN